MLAPRSIAFVGASPRPGSLGLAALRNLRSGGFPGALHLVNPRYRLIDGLPCLARLSEIGNAPNVVVIARHATVSSRLWRRRSQMASPPLSLSRPIRRTDQIPSRNACGRSHGERAIASSVLIASALLRRMRVSMRASWPTLSSPAISRSCLNPALSPRPCSRGRANIMSVSPAWSRSGIWPMCVRQSSRQLRIQFDNSRDLALCRGDRRCEAIHVRRACGSASQTIIVIKSGRSVQAAKAAATHTGALAGADDVYDAAFRRAELCGLPT